MIYENRLSDLAEIKAKKTMGSVSVAKNIDTTILQTISYEYPQRKITIELSTEEFTCLCPFSGLPDFAKITLQYIPRKKIIEMKSFKYYIIAYRNVKIYNEHVVNKILEDLIKVLNPFELSVVGEFTLRGGAANKITAKYKAKK